MTTFAAGGRLQEPCPGTILDSYVGGSFAPEMKLRRYTPSSCRRRSAAIGRLDQTTGVVEFRSAVLRGQLTSEVEAALRRDLHSQARVLSIGPAGESACRGLPVDRQFTRGRAAWAPSMDSNASRPWRCAGPGPYVAIPKAFLATCDACTATNPH